MIAALEQGLVFDCCGRSLVGVVHHAPSPGARIGVLFIVGGPQYRVGSHRQFTLMARELAAGGFPVLRFDYRGMGDSEGEPRDFESVQEDIDAAITTFDGVTGGALDGIVLFGLCDAASAVLMNCQESARVRALVLVNPWVKSERGEARSYVRHYYGKRVLQGSFWKKVLAGETRFFESISDFVKKLLLSRKSVAGRGNFVARMLEGMERFGGPTLLILSERDLTAREFDDLCATDDRWRNALVRERMETARLGGADHTFSRGQDQRAAVQIMINWLRRISLAEGENPCR